MIGQDLALRDSISERLRQVDLLTPGWRLAMMGAAFGFVLALGWLAVVRGAQADQSKLAVGLAAREMTLSEGAAELEADYPRVQAALTATEAAFQTRLERVDDALPDLIDAIIGMADASGVTLESLQPGLEEPGEVFASIPLSIRASGQFPGIAGLLGDIAGAPRILTLHDFLISATAEDRLLLSAEIRAYRYLETAP